LSHRYTCWFEKFEKNNLLLWIAIEYGHNKGLRLKSATFEPFYKLSIVLLLY